MIVSFLLNLVVLIVAAIFSLFPTVDKLPTVGGFDVDAALVSGMGSVNTFFTTFWPLQVMFLGFLALMFYYSVKMVMRFLLGHRAPGSH